jgi:hypothetical protein
MQNIYALSLIGLYKKTFLIYSYHFFLFPMVSDKNLLRSLGNVHGRNYVHPPADIPQSNQVFILRNTWLITADCIQYFLFHLSIKQL